MQPVTPKNDPAGAEGRVDGLPVLNQAEVSVLRALSQGETLLSLGALRARTSLPTDVLASALDSLRRRGLVSRLNTVVESYAARFPGLRVDD